MPSEGVAGNAQATELQPGVGPGSQCQRRGQQPPDCGQSCRRRLLLVCPLGGEHPQQVMEAVAGLADGVVAGGLQ
jgi:hypothetical protein